MSNEIQVFTNEKFGSVRTTVMDGKPWFVARDVAVALGYTNPRKAIGDHVDPSDKGVTKCDTLGGAQKMVVINESGLYSLVLSSKLPAAKQFKRWITCDVIPAIRQHGAYFSDEVLLRILADPAQAHMLVMEYIQEALENERLTKELESALPKAKYYDTFVNPMETTTLRETAKELGIPEKRFVQYLLDNHYLYRAPSGKLMPYACYTKQKLFLVRDFHLRNSPECGQYTLFTARGKEHFMHRVKEILRETR